VGEHRTKQTRNQRECYHLKLFIITPEFLKISVDFGTAFAAEAHQTEGQGLEEQLNAVPRSNMKADCFGERGTAFSAAEDIY
jgi:hypothetical protein